MILLGPPGLGKTHLAIGLGVKAAHAGYSLLFDTANNWIIRLTEAHQAGRLEAELKKIRRYKLIIIDEVGYIPFDHDTGALGWFYGVPRPRGVGRAVRRPWTILRGPAVVRAS